MNSNIIYYAHEHYFEWIWDVNMAKRPATLCVMALNTIKVTIITTSIQVSNKVVANSE
jgi:hypothetical protein